MSILFRDSMYPSFCAFLKSDYEQFFFTYDKISVYSCSIGNIWKDEDTYIFDCSVITEDLCSGWTEVHNGYDINFNELSGEFTGVFKEKYYYGKSKPWELLGLLFEERK